MGLAAPSCAAAMEGGIGWSHAALQALRKAHGNVYHDQLCMGFKVFSLCQSKFVLESVSHPAQTAASPALPACRRSVKPAVAWPCLVAGPPLLRCSAAPHTGCPRVTGEGGAPWPCVSVTRGAACSGLPLSLESLGAGGYVACFASD